MRQSTVDQAITVDSWSDYFENLFMREDRAVRNDRDSTDLFDNLVPITNSDCLNAPISQDEILNSFFSKS